jgi:MFS family permease
VRTATAGRLATWWADTSRGLPQPFWYLLAGTFVNRMGQMVTPFLALYLSGPRDFSPSVVGVVLACLGAGALASQPVGGYLADRVGRRATLVIGMVATAVSFMLLAAVRDLAWIAVAAALSGLAVDLYRPAVSAMIADLVAPENRPRAFALVYWAINLGVAFAGVTGGLLAERSFWLLFVLDAATCLAFAALIARKVPETRPPRDPSHTAGYAQALGDRLLLGLSASTLLGAIVYMQSLVTLPLAVEADGLGPGAFGLIYAVNPIVVIVAQVFVLRILDRIAGVRILVVSLVVMGVGFGMTAFASTVPMFALTVVVWTLGEVGFNAVAPALVADIAPVDLRGRYNGVDGMAYGAAALLGPLFGTRLFEKYGENVLWTACLLASLVSAALIAAMAPSIARRRAAMRLAPLPSQP